MKSLTPNAQIQGRAFNRCLWSILKTVYEENHIEESACDANVRSNEVVNSASGTVLGSNYFVDDEDSDDCGNNKVRIIEGGRPASRHYHSQSQLADGSHDHDEDSEEDEEDYCAGHSDQESSLE